MQTQNFTIEQCIFLDHLDLHTVLLLLHISCDVEVHLDSSLTYPLNKQGEHSLWVVQLISIAMDLWCPLLGVKYSPK